MSQQQPIDTLALATELTVAWLANPNTRVTVENVPAFLSAMHQALGNLGARPVEPAPAEPTRYSRAVSVRASLASPEVILSMIDGKPYRALTRHLNGHGLTPPEYRARYGLRADYPMVAPAFSEARRSMAKRLGLGRKPAQVVEPVAELANTAIRKTRRGGAAALNAARAALGTA